MPTDPKTPEGFSLRRWSRRKLEASREAMATEAPAPPAAPGPVTASSTPANVAGAPSTPAPAEPPLPPIESLTPESDFTVFMRPKVDASLRRQALKKLFGDPRFNVMDGLDVYIDDYTKPDPIPPSVLERLAQSGFVRGLGAPAEKSPPPVAQTPETASPAEPTTAADATRVIGAASSSPSVAESPRAADATDPPSER